MKYLKTAIKLWINRQIQLCQETSNEFHNQRTIEKLKYCGKNVKFNGEITITHPATVEIMDNVHIGTRSTFRGAGGIFIGENSHLSWDLIILTSIHNYQSSRLPYDETVIRKPVKIERNCWIGANVLITPGVTIGEGAVVGAGTVVSRDVPPLAVIGSQPYRVLKQRDAEHYHELDSKKKYGGAHGKPI
jgi:maltose O-acetyltransferase